MTRYSNRLKKTYSNEKIKNVTEILRGVEIFKSESNEILKNHGFLTKSEPEPKERASEIIENIFSRFHRVAIRLRKRYDKRDSFNINDEYDVQDLLHALLLQHFRDVREEEYTPSYAGSSTRMDFLLKNEKIVIETKKTRSDMNDRKLGDELILDKAHYKTHPDCEKLYCFVYDPDAFLKNPEGLIDDLSERDRDFVTLVYIEPSR